MSDHTKEHSQHAFFNLIRNLDVLTKACDKASAEQLASLAVQSLEVAYDLTIFFHDVSAVRRNDGNSRNQRSNKKYICQSPR